MWPEYCGFPLYIHFNEYSGSRLSEDRYHRPYKWMSWCCRSQVFCKGNVNQKNVFSVKLRWSLFVGAWAVDGRRRASIVLIDMFIWTHSTFHTGLRRQVATPLSAASGHAARVDSNHTALLNACMHNHTFLSSLLPSLRAVAYLRLVIRLRWCYDMWNMNISADLDETSVSSQWKPLAKDFFELLLKLLLSFSFSLHTTRKFLRNKPHV